MKYLITLKPLKHNTNHSSYSVLAELDLEKNTITRRIFLPAANFTNKSSYMRTFSQGLYKYKNEIYVAGWNFIVIVDYETFEIKDSFSHPLFSDIHSLAVTDKEIYVISTTIDSLLCFCKDKKELKWSWRIENSKLTNKISFPIFLAFLLKTSNFAGKVFRKLGLSKYFKIEFKNKDFRGTDKTHSPYHTCHLNEVNILDDNNILLGTKGWDDWKFKDGATIKLDKNTMAAELLAKPGSFSGAHDLLIVNNKIYITESGNESIGVLDLHTNEIKHFLLEKDNFFVRGIALAEDGFLVGLSPSRTGVDREGTTTLKHKQPEIHYYTSDFTSILKKIKLDMFYPDNVGGAIHNIFRID